MDSKSELDMIFFILFFGTNANCSVVSGVSEDLVKTNK